ncbi:MAG: hypothetical protein HYT71_02030 [Candidatus Aenigmarchaeota archaeon]|nr:hypothetical protein [Candidatus Aenigmarchaeota archaeon]
MVIADMKKLLVFELSDTVTSGADEVNSLRIREAISEAGRIRRVSQNHGLRYEETSDAVKNGGSGYAPRRIKVYLIDPADNETASAFRNATGTWYASHYADK